MGGFTREEVAQQAGVSAQYVDRLGELRILFVQGGACTGNQASGPFLVQGPLDEARGTKSFSPGRKCLIDGEDPTSAFRASCRDASPPKLQSQTSSKPVPT